MINSVDYFRIVKISKGLNTTTAFTVLVKPNFKTWGKMVAQTTYQTNRPTNLTNLQRRLWAHYDNSVGKFGSNYDVLGEITHIAGNRGYSHARRAKEINEKLSAVKGNLSVSERKYAHDLLDISYSYLRETRNTRDKKVRFRREVKDYSSVINQIRDLRMDYQSNSGYGDFVSSQSGIEEQVAQAEPGIVQYKQDRTQGRDLLSRVRDALNIRRQVVQHRTSRYRMAGKFAIKGLVATAIVALLAGGVGYVGDIYKGLTKEITELKKDKGALGADKKALIVKRDELLERLKVLENENKELTPISDKAKSDEVEATSDLYEAEQVDKIFSALMGCMRFPMARSTVQNGAWGDISIMTYDLSKFPKTKQELWQFAKRAHIFYDAGNAEEGPPADDEFARLCKEAGVDDAFFKQVADGQHIDALNVAASMADNLHNSMSKLNTKGFLVTKDADGKSTYYATLEQIANVKSGGLGW